MAIIKEYNSGGTTIKIADDYMAKTEEENRLRRSMLDDVARRIIEKIIEERIIANEKN